MKTGNPSAETMAEAFAKRLKKLRKDQYMTQKQLAEKSKISVAYASKLEQGRAIPSDAILENIASALNCDAIWLRNGNPRDVKMDELIGSIDTGADGLEKVSTAKALQCRQLLQDSLQDINDLISILREADALYDFYHLQKISQHLHITTQIADVMLHAKNSSSDELIDYYEKQFERMREVLKQK